MKTHPVIRFLVTLLLVVSAGFAQAKVTFEGGDGSSIEKAIVIKGADTASGVAAEYDYIRKHFPGSKVGNQRLLSEKGRAYDVIEIKTKDGEDKTIHFDITEFFGK